MIKSKLLLRNPHTLGAIDAIKLDLEEGFGRFFSDKIYYNWPTFGPTRQLDTLFKSNPVF